MPDYSPFPDAFSNVVDENTWLKMNKGYVADLDSLQATPAPKVQSFPTNDVTPVSFSYFINISRFYFAVINFDLHHWEINEIVKKKMVSCI